MIVRAQCIFDFRRYSFIKYQELVVHLDDTLGGLWVWRAMVSPFSNSSRGAFDFPVMFDLVVGEYLGILCLFFCWGGFLRVGVVVRVTCCDPVVIFRHFRLSSWSFGLVWEFIAHSRY